METKPLVPWTKNVLVVANVTAMSDELFAALRACAQKGPSAFTLVVPASRSAGGRAAADQRLRTTLERLRAAGLAVDGWVDDGDPIDAVSVAWKPGRYDEIIVSTLPMPTSKWLQIGLPQRIAGLTGALVTHVVSKPPRPPVETVHVQPPADDITGPLAPLRAWKALEARWEPPSPFDTPHLQRVGEIRSARPRVSGAHTELPDPGSAAGEPDHSDPRSSDHR